MQMRFRRPDRAAWLFTFRATLASLIALGIAIGFHLASPQWAPITAWIVAQPSRGKTVSKGFYRFLGTLVGALGAVFLMAFLGQSPWFFMLLLAGWVGFTCWGANLVQYFRSYGAVLAGYTTSIVSLLVFSHPAQVTETASARIICILLGITVAVTVTGLLSRPRSKAELFAAQRELVAGLCDWTARVLLRDPRPELLFDEQELVTKLSAFEELAAYAASESMQIRRQRKSLLRFIANAFGAISAIRAFGLGLRQSPELLATTVNERNSFSKTFRELARGIREGRDDLSPSGLGLEQFAAGTSFVNDRARNLVQVLQSVFDQARAVSKSEPATHSGARSFYLDLRHARLVGIRSAISVFLAGAVWLWTGWSAGPLLVMMVAVNSGIFATSNDPKGGLVTTFKASLIAVGAALATFFLLAHGPHAEWFLYLILALFLIPGGLVIARPDLTTAGTLYCANYLVFVSPSFPMPAFELQRFLSIGAGFFASIAMSFAFYFVIFPADVHKRHEQMIDDFVRDLERIARAPSRLRAFEWETLLYNRVGRLIKLLVERGEMTTDLLESSFAALDLGREIFRWQEASPGYPADSAERRAVLSFLTIMSSFARDPVGAAEKIGALADVPAPLRPAFDDVARTLRQHADFLRRA